jgi:hypothetical protein
VAGTAGRCAVTDAGMSVLREFAPVDGDETVVTAVACVSTVVAFAFITRVYRTRTLWVAVVGVCISWVPVQLLALAFEGRQMWLPHQHSAVFFWGDLVALPSIAVGFSLLRHRWDADHVGALSPPVPLADRRWWLTVVLVIAVTISYAYHGAQIDTWPFAGLHSPSKAWHDFFVYPVFLYFLVSQVPFLVQTPWRRQRGIACGLVALVLAGTAMWFVLGFVYDPAMARHQLPFFWFT